MLPRILLFLGFALFVCASGARAHDQDAVQADIKRVKISQNNDGSQTTYEVDAAERKAVATTTARDGKRQSRIRYELDEAGRFARGDVFGADDRLRLKTQYKYDASGRLEEERQFTVEGVLKNKLVYAYDQLTGRQSGYAIYDAAGNLLARSNASGPAPSAAPVARPSATPRK